MNFLSPKIFLLMESGLTTIKEVNMITMPFNNDDEPMGDNYDYGYFPDDADYEVSVYDY